MKYLDLVNIKQGTDSVMRFSNGNTLPLTQVPFGMTAFAPQTATDRWYYHPKAKCLEGVRITHQPSPWIADYGTLIFMPQTQKPGYGPDERWSGYRPADAVLRPEYIKLHFLKSRSVFELTPTERGGVIRVSYDDNTDNKFSVLPLTGDASFEYDADNSVLSGYVTNCHDQYTVNFKMYFYIVFNKDEIAADENLIYDNGKLEPGNKVNGNECGIHLSVAGKTLNAKVATSYISAEQAKLNYIRELADKDFETVRSSAADLWEKRLSCVEIEAKDEKQLKTFYSCMYRAFLYPHKCYEINEAGEPVHYAPCDGKVHAGVRYTDNGFWDTYRTVYPFYSIVAPDDYREMCRGFVNDYLECGWLPRWPSIGERGCMPSTLIDAVLCDAAVKKIIDGDVLENALDGMLKHAQTASEIDDFGRSGVESYLKYGYVPYGVHIESVNLTLDAAYGDWCIAVIADILGKKDIAEKYIARSYNYKNLFDAKTGFMRPKDENGDFRPDFSPTGWGRDYTEGSAWQNSFAVPHDIDGLAELYGGKEALMAKIDELFATPPIYENVGYFSEIHEMTEMAAADFGQCAISNQPSFHIPYIYSALGNVQKTSDVVEAMCETVFSFEDDGFPGDEDNGSMALWYVFSVIGFYPFCPGKAEYVRTKSLAKSVKINGTDITDILKNDVPINHFELIKLINKKES